MRKWSFALLIVLAAAGAASAEVFLEKESPYAGSTYAFPAITSDVYYIRARHRHAPAPDLGR